jgi:hypothetical protein
MSSGIVKSIVAPTFVFGLLGWDNDEPFILLPNEMTIDFERPDVLAS